MMKPRCSECGDTKPLNEDGVCRSRGGCEHRQFQHEARMRRLQEEMDHAEHCPIHGRNSSMYEQFITGVIMGGPIFGTGWLGRMDRDIFGEIEDDQ